MTILYESTGKRRVRLRCVHPVRGEIRLEELVATGFDEAANNRMIEKAYAKLNKKMDQEFADYPDHRKVWFKKHGRRKDYPIKVQGIMVTPSGRNGSRATVSTQNGKVVEFLSYPLLMRITHPSAERPYRNGYISNSFRDEAGYRECWEWAIDHQIKVHKWKGRGLRDELMNQMPPFDEIAKFGVQTMLRQGYTLVDVTEGIEFESLCTG